MPWFTELSWETRGKVNHLARFLQLFYRNLKDSFNYSLVLGDTVSVAAIFEWNLNSIGKPKVPDYSHPGLGRQW